MSRGKMEKYYPKRIQSIMNGETPLIRKGYEGEKDAEIYAGEFIDREGVTHKKYKGSDGKEFIRKDSVKIDLRVYEKLNIRCPLFCPSCNKTMKTKADEKMWTLKSKCHKCVSKEEQEIRVAGYWPLYEKIQIDRNKLSFLVSSEIEMKNYLENGLSKELAFVNEDGTIEKWNNEAFQETKTFLEKELVELTESLGIIQTRLTTNLGKWNETGLSKI